MKRVAATAVALLIAAGTAVGFAQSSTAVTATVPNYLYCNWINECRQINGGYVASVPTHCHRVLFLSGSPNRRVALCDKWV